MGFVSWKCAVSGERLMNIFAVENGWAKSEQADCYLVTPYVTYHEPNYEGYAEFDGNFVFKLIEDAEEPFEIKIVLAKYYEGQSYGELGVSEYDNGQGYFSSE